ncbi:putative ibr domain-containing protein [Neofusicoccum parvum UCRNP2]|uniref:RBR-type E3 ubiquitin transferase n=1 Tax=Botryosphaeria parva (strain UCR-NP2) TaxID=1287680 RepID=R1GXM9_BOTPV|nr:putative ibr domain-containing protein [Neofusicoccum parvum UCRNP2]
MGLLDGVGAIFAPRPRPPKDHDRARHRDSYADHDQARSSRRARRNTYDHPQHYHRHSPSPADAPDVDHLRQARAEYYARPPEQRTRRPSAPAATPARPNHRHDMEPRRAMSTRKHPKSKRHEDDRRTNRKEREDRDSGVYVYSTPRSGGSRNRQEDVGDSRSRAGPHRRTVSSPAAQNIIDVEVEREPEPSVRREDGVRISRLSCGHRMCHACLKRQFELSVKDPQHMPPRCCTNEHIPLKYVDRIFDTKFKVLWNKKYQEYTAKNRVYCPTRGCGEWIKPSHIRMDHTVGRKYGKCPRCRGKVCVKCNGRWHVRKECPKDEEMQRIAEMAKESGWQRCYNCKAMVELKEGCNHMTCRCTAQFCMLCGLKWKTCECPWFNYAHLDDEDRLQNMRVPEPYVVVERDVRGAPAPPRAPPNAQPDQYAVPAPRRNHPIYVNEDRAPSPARTRATRTHAYADPREHEDEMLARRLQSQFLADAAGGSRHGGGGGPSRHHTTRQRQRPASRYSSPEIEVEVLGVGNAAGHHMNDFGVPAAAAPAPRSTIIRRSTRPSRRATEADRETARNMGYAAHAAQAAQPAQHQYVRRPPVEASVMAGLGDPQRSGMGRVGMWLNYVENDPAEVEGRAQRVAAAAY